MRTNPGYYKAQKKHSNREGRWRIGRARSMKKKKSEEGWAWGRGNIAGTGISTRFWIFEKKKIQFLGDAGQKLN